MRRLIAVILSAVVVVALGVAGVGYTLVAPQPRVVGEPPRWLNAESVSIAKPDGSHTAGWYLEGRAGMPAVLLLHPIRSDRRAMLGRARFLADAGFAVLLVDLQAHGETPGAYIGLGYREAADAHAAVGFLTRRRPGAAVGVIGVSLGGAAALLGDGPVDADAVVLESVFDSIDNAVASRIARRLGAIGRHLAPLLTLQIEPRLGVPRIALRPVTAIGRLSAPVLIISGDRDEHTPVEATRRLFAAAHDPKALWLVEGAAHVDLHAYDADGYERRVLGFLQRHLRRPASDAVQPR